MTKTTSLTPERIKREDFIIGIILLAIGIIPLATGMAGVVVGITSTALTSLIICLVLGSALIVASGLFFAHKK